MTTSRPDLAGLTITIEILQARDLIAKDRSLLGKRTTSDTYCKVQIGANQKLGQTKVVPKTLSPVWNETFRHVLGADAAARLVQPEYHDQAASSTCTLSLWDHDKVGGDDFMGAVVIPLDPNHQAESTTQWYAVGKRSGLDFCKNAKGEVQVKVTFEGSRMMQVSRGQQKTLLYNRIRVGLAWNVERGQHVDLDSSCVAIDKNGQVLLKETVYYGNLTNSNLAVQHSGDEQTGEAIGDDEKILLELDRIPAKIVALYLILTVATSGKTFSDVRSAKARFIATETSQGICSYVPHAMGANNTALFLCRIARGGQEAGSNNWLLTPIEEGDTVARDFGSLIPQIKGYTRDLVPNLTIDQHDRVAIMRKGGVIRVSDYVPGGKIPALVSFGLAWDITNGVNIDLDASAIMLDTNFQLQDVVYFKQLTSKDGSIRHSGDEREGDESGDDETLNISLHRVSENVKYIGFVVNSYSGQELDDVDKAACHLFDPKTKIDIASYQLTNCKEVDKHTALVMACLYRGDKDPDDWYLAIISLPAQGKLARENVDDLQTHLLTNPPPPPSAFVIEQEEEIDLSVMPDAVPMDDEIVVVPEGQFQQYSVPVEDQEIVL